MNRKSFIISSVIVAVVSWILDYILHGVILADAYMKYASLWGSMEQMKAYWWMLPFAYFIMSFMMGYFFIKGYEGKGIMEGLRFGLWMGVLMQIPRFIFEVNYYSFPKIFDISNLVGGMVKFVVLGILFAVLYKPASKA